MLETVLFAVGILVLFVGVVFVHELGHYYAGRQITGIPGEDIRIVVATFPQYVALRDPESEEWVSPTEYDRYRDVYDQYDPDGEHAERFVAAGELIQAAVVVPLAVALGLAGFDTVAASLVVVSLVATLVSVLFDALLSYRASHPMGDYSTLWQVDRRAPVTLLTGFVLVHLGTFAVIG